MTLPALSSVLSRRHTVVLALVGALALAACSGGDDVTTPEPPTVDAPTTTTSPPTTTTVAPTTTTEPPNLADARISLTEVASLVAPTALTSRPGDDAVYIAEKPGRVRALRNGAVDPTAVLDVTGVVSTGNEQGLLGLAFSPGGENLYVDYTDSSGDTRVVEYAMDGSTADPGSAREILTVGQPFANHNGGELQTGPDGMLYVALGDGGSAGDPQGNGQNTSTLLGTILRIDPAGGDPYGVPADNPFVGAGDSRGEIWVYGLRNPWRFSFDSGTGDLWIGDVGQDSIEEIDYLPADGASGANLGWPVFEGSQAFGGGSADNAVGPVFEYDRSNGECAVTGGYVYRGSAIPDLVGAYVYGDFCLGNIDALTVGSGALTAQRSLDANVPSLASFGEGPDGELYALSLDGPVYRIDPA